MKNIVLAAAAVAVAFAVPASAQTFAGPYVGVEIGHDGYEVKGEDVLGSGIDFDGISGNGVVGGVFAGYDLPLTSSIFVGVEAFGNLSAAKISATYAGDTYSAKARGSFGASARVGTMINDSTAVYARGGVIDTRFKLSDGVDTYANSQTGFQYGGGIETRVGSKASVRVEYIANDYNSAGIGNGVKVGNGQVRAGASFRF
ncbi:outer membrane protein [Hephaestia sp. GCM10023244]|uniref:outer membrane protein n=1 Tax=unclassified Hephaestia TaxID=2631281 RepID=UPI0020771CD6|nr:outer membrane beta-barrel protein [Hephaestia sp. MAHUQ-44]MCM8730735.1 porin family protein [Hephaestia sp. MAHUQ-44]